MKPIRVTLGGCILACLMMQLPALAQSEQQTIALKENWNLVWLKVDPPAGDDPADPQNHPSKILAGLDYHGVWSFESMGKAGVWLYHLKGQPEYVNTLHAMRGGRGYLIKMNVAGTLTVTGAPVGDSSSFSSRTGNLFGIHLEPGQSPTFNEYFRFGGARDYIVAIYKLTGNVFTPVSTISPIESDVSYWILFSQDFKWEGPVRVRAPATGYQFGKRGYIDKIVIEVPYDTRQQELTVKAVPAATPGGGEPADAGNGDLGWLQYRDEVTDPDKPAWKPLATPVTLTIAAGQTMTELTIRCNRMACGCDAQGENCQPCALATLQDDPPRLYQATIQITFGDATRSIPAGMEVAACYGVYVGRARLNRVSLMPPVDPPPTPADVEAINNPPDDRMKLATSMTMALILVLPEPGGGGPDAWLLDEAKLKMHRDGRPINYRYNAAMFHQRVELDATEPISPIGTAGTLEGELRIEALEPLHPYRHQYNPEHRSWNDITRKIKLAFSQTDEDPLHQFFGLSDSAGNNELNGVYTEVIHGLSLYPIKVQGRFKLVRLTQDTHWPFEDD